MEKVSTLIRAALSTPVFLCVLAVLFVTKWIAVGFVAAFAQLILLMVVYIITHEFAKRVSE